MYPAIDRLCKLLLTSVVFISPIFISTVASKALAQTATAANEGSLRELVSRLVGTSSELLPGQLPPQLPVELPMPEQAQIIGSVVSRFEQQELYRIFLNAPQTAEQLTASYQQQLQATGWRMPETPSLDTIGFVASYAVFPTLVFCSESQELTLTINSVPESPTSSTVDLSLYAIEPNDYSVCTTSASDRPEQPGAAIPLPALTPPADARVENANGGGSNQEWTARASIESSLSQQALMTHYTAQLEQAGWRQQATDTRDRSAWSVLTLEDEQGQLWQALLSITPETSETANAYGASIIVVQP